MSVTQEDVLADALERLVMAYQEWTELPSDEAWRLVCLIAMGRQDA